MDLTQRELDDLKFAFALLDRDGEGSFQARDLGNFLRCLGKKPTDSELQAMVNQVDTDGNGIIDFEEFVQAMILRLSTEQDEDSLRDAFRIYDKDNSGYIGVDQIRDVMVDLNLQPTDEEIEEMIREGDEDNDGYLGYEDFIHMMSPK